MNLRNLILVVFIIQTMIVLSGCSKENAAKSKPAMSSLPAAPDFDGGMPNPPFNPAPLIKKANDRWPYPEVLKTYQKAVDLHNSGKSDEAVKLIRTIVDKEIRLRPDDDTELSNETFFGPYMGGRLMPALGVIGNVISANETYAETLAKSGDLKSSMSIHAINACITRQVIHTMPPDNMILTQGNNMWASAWESISAGFAASKDKQKAKEASRISREAKKFANVRINAASDISDPLSISGRNELKRTVEMWDEDVDTESSSDLLNQLLGE
ncbi:MAG: hypothetical protein ACYC27_21060 [Armatimonadota bacterium]